MPQKTREAMSLAGFLLPAFFDSIAFFLGAVSVGVMQVLTSFDLRPR